MAPFASASQNPDSPHNMMQEESKETGLEVLDTMTLMSKKSVPN